MEGSRSGVTIKNAEKDQLTGRPNPTTRIAAESAHTIPTDDAPTGHLWPTPIMMASSIARNMRRSSNTDRMFQTVDLSYYDANGDGKISREEFVDKPNRAFVLLDKDNTCRLSSAQVAGARAHTEQIFDSKKASSGDPRENCPKGIKC
jgi:hypothetical protein